MSPVEIIYLACPFRHPDPLIQSKRYVAVNFVAAQLSLQGRYVFSPLTHNLPLIEIMKDALPGEHWMQFDLAILSSCKLLYVLKMDGWESSKGVQREIVFAKERRIPIEELTPPREADYLGKFINKVPNSVQF